MQAKERKLLDLLRQPVQLTIHRDHGAYGSQPDHRTVTVHDLVRYRREPVAYFGSEGGLHHDSVERIPLLLSHHFLTSVFIFIAALAQAIEKAKDFRVITSRKLIRGYLMNDAEEGLLRYKLLPFDTADRESMILLIEKGMGSEMPSEAMRRDFHSFSGELKQVGKDHLASLYHQLCDMTVFEACLKDRFGSSDIENLILLGRKLDDLTNAPRPQVAD